MSQFTELPAIDELGSYEMRSESVGGLVLDVSINGNKLHLFV